MKRKAWVVLAAVLFAVGTQPVWPSRFGPGLTSYAGEVTGVTGSAADTVPFKALARMPVKELTIFKDGHAFVLHRGKLPVSAVGHTGNVVMDHLPTPVIGTFWPYSADPAAELKSVVAGKRRVRVVRTALQLRELLEANVGAEVFISERGGKDEKKETYAATILGIPERSAAELEALSPPNTGARLPQKGAVILLQTAAGVKVIALNKIADVTFKRPPKTTVASEEFRNILTLQLDWKRQRVQAEVEVGMVYLQRGIRWIPSYRLTLDGNGSVTVELQATLVNELTDLRDVTANLVIGVPAFAFKGTPDPISLQRTVARLSQYFQENSQTAYAFSNAIMTQQVRMTELSRSRRRPASEAGLDLGPDIAKGVKTEDLFIFTVKHISLRKGERMVLPIAKYILPYEDVYTLDLPFTPPTGMRQNFNNRRRAELARLFHTPKAVHKIRLRNRGKYPLTTAPALLLHQGRILSQGMMTYTPIGGVVDLELTPAINIAVRRSEKETKRTPNAANWHNRAYDRIDLAGVIGLTNHSDKTVRLEINRGILGNPGSADHGATVRRLNALEDDNYLGRGGRPYWWNWYSWGDWWHHFNGLGRITWKLELKPGESVELHYDWHYFWR